MADDSNHPNFDYDPSKPLTIIFAIVFAGVLIAHTILMFRPRALWLLPLVISTAMETFGYIFRYFAAKNQDSNTPFIASTVLLVVAPTFLAASDYMLVGRLISFVGSEYSLIRHTRISKIFVTLDIISILTQSGAAVGVTSSNVNAIKTSKDVILASLALQVISFTVFLYIAVSFHLKANRGLGHQMQSLRPIMIAFYISGVLITVRSIYRFVEFATIKTDGTSKSYFETHEWPLYVLDSFPILIATGVFLIWHPRKFIPAVKGDKLIRASSPFPGFQEPMDTTIPLRRVV